MSPPVRGSGISWQPSGASAPIVCDVSLELRHGEVLALVGPNGAGKSSLLGILAGHTVPEAGEVEYDGMPISRLDPRALALRRAVVSQRPAAPVGFMAREVVELGRAPWHGMPGRRDERAIVERALRDADVSAFQLRPVQRLSGGERARVAMARALAQDVPILLLDEPTAALDPRHQHALMTVARRHAREGGAVLAVLHDLNLAATYSDRIALMRAGRVVACDSADRALDAAVLSAVYEHRLDVVMHPLRPGPLVLSS